MKKKAIIIPVLITLIFGVICFTSCGKDKKNNFVLTTIFPITEMAKEIAGDKMEIRQLITINDPHHYEPSTADQKLIYDAKAILYVDEEFEHELAEYFEKQKTVGEKAYMISKNIDKIKVEGAEHHHEDEGEGAYEHGHKHNEDPHIWTSPKRALQMLKNITDAIVTVDSANKKYYLNNYEKYKLKLEEVDKEYANAAQAIEQKDVFLTHGAFAYLSDYGFTQKALTRGHEEASSQEIAEFVDELIEHNVENIFYVDKEGKEKELADRLVQEVRKKNSSSNIKAKYIDRLIVKNQNDLITTYKYNLSVIKG